jgi:N4-(beta-N-acetylglucosaminyl)-L-asparaginase
MRKALLSLGLFRDLFFAGVDKKHGRRGVVAHPPLVVHTWGAFSETGATAAAYDALLGRGDSNPNESRRVLDAVMAGSSTCERMQCGKTVGYGGSPDGDGGVSLDAMIMDGDTMDVGAVSNLRHTREAIAAARLVLEYTEHTQLAGEEADRFASQFGGLTRYESLTTDGSTSMWSDWKANNCQPNFFKKNAHIVPNPGEHCGPYSVGKPREGRGEKVMGSRLPTTSHDTISVLAVDESGHIACGSSTNGLRHKIAGRVGDASTPGGAAYCEDGVGACVATGDGDIHLRFLPCLRVIESIRRGMRVQDATDEVMGVMLTKAGPFDGAIVAWSAKDHEIGSSTVGDTFSFSYAYISDGGGIQVVPVRPLGTEEVSNQ